MIRFSKYLPLLVFFGTVTAIYAAPDGSPQGAGTGSGSAQKQVTMTVEEMSAKAAGIEAQLNEDTREVMHLKDVAKKQKDVIKLNCVNDRLVELKAQRNIADVANGSLQSALSRSSDDRYALFTQYKGIGENVRGLREQATACIGAPELMKQESGVEVHHPDIPDDPNGTSFDPALETPGYASAFQ